ncbi:hypothetical protein Hamer_G009840 [Homarus americanus]|uniref:Uncharacterized protein n=1 Tax=Homarus americanus TaxID=6706 RepID=A0A8J5TNB6_HOMAM|nr:hypothetical protein Hamer_G009840 [Homarus americanus]
MEQSPSSTRAVTHTLTANTLYRCFVMKMLVPLLLTSALLVVAVTASRRDCPPGPFPPNFKTNMKKCLCDDEGIDEEACKTKVNQIKDSFKTCVTSIIDEFDLTVGNSESAWTNSSNINEGSNYNSCSKNGLTNIENIE